jgi:RNA polymerase sigma factor (sigma-70 family)
MPEIGSWIVPPDFQLLLDRDEAEWSRCYNYLFAVARKAARRILGDALGHEVDDIASDAVVRLWNGVHLIQQVQAFMTYLSAIAVNRARTLARKLARQPAHVPFHEVTDEEFDTANRANPDLPGDGAAQELVDVLAEEYHLEGHQTDEVLAQLLSSSGLNPNERKVFRKHVLEGRSQPQVSQAEGIPLGTVGRAALEATSKVARHIRFIILCEGVTRPRRRRGNQ